jgi:hypothetical protein
MPWEPKVVAVSIGLDETGYAHMVVNGSRTITVTHHRHQNYDHIVTRQLGNGYVEQTGVGKRKADLTPHPEAVAVASALNSLERCPQASVSAEIDNG